MIKKRFSCFVLVLIFIASLLHAQSLEEAIRNGDVESVKSILKKNPGLLDKEVNSLLKPLHYAAYLGKKEIAQYLISKGANIDEEIGGHSTPLNFAVRYGNLSTAAVLIENGADIFSKTPQGTSYLHFAILSGKKEMVGFLIDKGLDVNVVKKGNMTPLHIAAVSGNKEIVEFLVQRGADLNVRSTDGGTPLHFAEASGNKHIVELLKSKEAKELKREFPLYKGKYLGMKRPGDTLEAFAPELFSDVYGTHTLPTFSPDGKELYWEAPFIPGRMNMCKIWFMREENGRWSPPRMASFSDFPSGAPAFSPDGKRLFFISNRPRQDNAGQRDYDLWFVERKGTGWSKPKHLGNKINTDKTFERAPFVTGDGTLYYTVSGKGIVKSAFVNGRYTKPESLGDLFNSDYVDSCKDREHIIFSSNRRKGDFQYELFISFHKPDGRWSKAIYMGDKLHQGNLPGWGGVTFDGKYLFIVKTNHVGFYWMDARIIDELKAKALIAKE
jgi:ankyrin repeat protein